MMMICTVVRATWEFWMYRRVTTQQWCGRMSVTFCRCRWIHKDVTLPLYPTTVPSGYGILILFNRYCLPVVSTSWAFSCNITVWFLHSSIWGSDMSTCTLYCKIIMVLTIISRTYEWFARLAPVISTSVLISTIVLYLEFHLLLDTTQNLGYKMIIYLTGWLQSVCLFIVHGVWLGLALYWPWAINLVVYLALDSVA